MTHFNPYCCVILYVILFVRVLSAFSDLITHPGYVRATCDGAASVYHVVSSGRPRIRLSLFVPSVCRAHKEEENKLYFSRQLNRMIKSPPLFSEGEFFPLSFQLALVSF